MWSLPCPNTQRDVKKFQVFRRRPRRATGPAGNTTRTFTAIEGPFELIKEFDFDDSIVRTANTETPSPILVERVNDVVGNYLDLDFNRDSSAIYAVCAVDAHSLSSNYSVQFEVSFDRFKNRIVKKLISQSGAPKSYPNLYLNEDAFQDTIRDSGHSRVRIFFDPEVLALKDADGNDLRLIATVDEGAEYRIQLINTDLQDQEVVEISVEDLR
jgi:hypothetical protein